MTRNTVHHRTPTVLASIWRRVRRMRPAAGQIKPLARTARAAARQQTDKTRAWAAPQVERAAQALQDSIAPKASSLLSAAAHHIDPAPQRPLRWRKLAGASAAAAGVSAVAAFAAAVRRRLTAGNSAATEPAEAGDTASEKGDTASEKGDTASVAETAPEAGDPASEAETAPEAATHNGQPSPGSDVPHGSGARTS